MWDKKESDKKSSHNSSDVNEVNKGGRPKGSGINRNQRLTVYLTENEKLAVDVHFEGKSVSSATFCRDVLVAMAANPSVAEKIAKLVYPNAL